MRVVFGNQQISCSYLKL